MVEAGKRGGEFSQFREKQIKKSNRTKRA